jgi:hypothetical protein
MDDYRAIVINRDDKPDEAWWLRFPTVQYRRGELFRSDGVAIVTGDVPATPRPAEGTDLAAWWKKQLDLFWMCPQNVEHGSVRYSISVQPDPDGKSFEITDVKRYDSNSKELFPIDYSMRPEFACRPPLGAGDEHHEARLDLHPADGPPGCILLTVRHTTRDGRVDAKGAGLPDENRFWLDPARDYIAMRWDMVLFDDEGRPRTISSHIMDSVAKSPGGVWYATRVRRKNSVQAQDGSTHDDLYDIYVDFSVRLTDRDFEPPKVGKFQLRQ